MLRWRLFSACIIIGTMLTLVALDVRSTNPGMWLAPVLLLLSVMGTEEVFWLLKSQDHRPVVWPVYLGNFLLALNGCRPIWMRLLNENGLVKDPLLFRIQTDAVDASFLLSMSLILVFVVEMMRYTEPGKTMQRVAFSCFALLYVGLSLQMLAALRFVGIDAKAGLLALLSVLVIVKMADTGAYFVGRAIGKHKMTPLLSPGKTWEGLAGGLLAACGAGAFMFYFIAPRMVAATYHPPSMLVVLIYSIALAVAGMIGDLSESLLKRDMRQKDSSSWLPGLGGVLDIIDSVLLAAPIALLFWNLGLMRG